MKARILALMLSVSVAFSGIPATSVSAAPAEYETVVEEAAGEVSEEESEAEEMLPEGASEEIILEETTEEETFLEETMEESIEESLEETMEAVSEEEPDAAEESEESVVEETLEETVMEESSEEETILEDTTVKEAAIEEIVESATAKVVGSNGIVYDDIVYLSAKTYKKLSKDAQAAYVELCDSLAEQKEKGIEVKNAVIYVDKEGNLGLTASIPAQDIFNMPSMEEEINEENFELANQIRAVGEVVTDGIPAEELDTFLRDGSYFKKQITDSDSLRLYDLANSAMVSGGRNSFSYSNSRYLSWTPVCDALSALILTYPNKFNWADWGNGQLHMSVSYRSRVYNYTFTLDKSPYYSSALETKANKKVKELLNNAYEYAASSYPNAPTYGIIKYFDKWICENNYYNQIGVDTSGSGHTKQYYYCHSCYGILLNGYGVCESYALAMTRLLDAAGIRNVYVVGDAGGGHAWNYVEMPDGKWYMLDSTWNDGGSSSNGKYLLSANDGVHKGDGARWIYGMTFKFPTLSTSGYGAGKADPIAVNKTEVVIKPNATVTLKVDSTSNKTNYYNKFKKTWSSSDKTIAKVSSSGKVTGVAPGKAVITCTIAGKKINTTVYVYQFTGNKFAENDKANYTWKYANADTVFNTSDAKTFTLNIGQKNAVLTAEQIGTKLSLAQPKVTSSKKAIAEVSNVALSGNKITFKVTAKALGSSVITVKYAGKTSTLNVNVSQAIKASWFDFSEVVNVEYNGKAFKPKVTLTAEGKAVKPKLTYKVTYTNNKNAGTATVTVTGTGKYGSSITKNFTIAKKDPAGAKFTKCTPATKNYNGKPQAVKTTLKLGSTVLKAGVDYDVLYNGSTTVPTKAGKYTVTVQTKGNYKTLAIKTLASGVAATYEIKPVTIAKVTVTCPEKIKTGKTLNYKVKIGKNVLTTDDYTVSITDKDGKAVNAYTTPGTYKLVITVKGSNVLPKEKADGTKVTSITKTFKVVK